MKTKMVGKSDPAKLVRLCQGILDLENISDPSSKENTHSVKRALDGLAHVTAT